MARPKKQIEKRKVKILDDEDNVIETSEVGLPGVIRPGILDIEEELSGMDSFREYLRTEDFS